MNKLIKITTNEQGSQVVSARELHEFLEVGSRFNDWFNNMLKYGFEENIDYTSFTKNLVSGGKTKEYALTLDMAKELSMIQRSEKGKQARQYFIESEKELNAIKQNQFSIPQTFEEALRLAADTEREKQELSLLVSIQQKDIEVNKSKVSFANTLLADDTTTYTLSEGAKLISNHPDINIGRNTLYEYLRKIHWVQSSSLEPYQSIVNKGYLVLKLHTIKNTYGIEVVKHQTLITSKGIDYVIKRLLKEEVVPSLFN